MGGGLRAPHRHAASRQPICLQHAVTACTGPHACVRRTAAKVARTFRTNIYSHIFMARAAWPHMGKGAAIINTSSVTAYKVRRVTRNRRMRTMHACAAVSMPVWLRCWVPSMLQLVLRAHDASSHGGGMLCASCIVAAVSEIPLWELSRVPEVVVVVACFAGLV